MSHIRCEFDILRIEFECWHTNIKFSINLDDLHEFRFEFHCLVITQYLLKNQTYLAIFLQWMANFTKSSTSSIFFRELLLLLVVSASSPKCWTDQTVLKPLTLSCSIRTCSCLVGQQYSPVHAVINPAVGGPKKTFCTCSVLLFPQRFCPKL